jgi:uncharacterized membrane protein
MRIQQLFISYLFVMPLFVTLMVVLLIMSWTIERFQLKK